MSAVICLELTEEQALVLFEYLSRSNANDPTQIEDQSERRVLWNLESDLERALPAVLSPDNKRILREARDRVRDS